LPNASGDLIALRQNKGRDGGEETLMQHMHGAVTAEEAAEIIGRLERIPYGAWHRKARAIIGAATFFDGLDLLAVAYVVPVLAPLWGLNPQKIGLLISSGFLGQLVGALVFGWVAERFGRMPAMVWSIALFSIMSLACAAAWGFQSFLVLRFLQGIGLGGELPVAATYIGEVSKAKGRGQSILYYQVLFAFGLAGCGLLALWVVPHLGWQVLFLIGGIPALIVLFLRASLPESPRWLVNKGRLSEAVTAIARIERETPGAAAIPVMPIPLQVQRRAAAGDLFGPTYLRRTLSVWVIWFATSLVNFGIAAWLPQMYRSFYHLDVASALQLNFVTSAAGLLGTIACTLLIDRVSRRTLFTTVFLASGLLLLCLGTSFPAEIPAVVVLVSAAYFFISFTSIGAYVYTPEIYPTRIRAFGAAAASSWARIASIAGPNIVAAILASQGVNWVFIALGAVAVLAGFLVLVLVVDTKSRLLEEVSP
jgi:MFS transporter, putative metabolite:H+ symporter